MNTKELYQEFSNWINRGYFSDFEDFAELVLRDHRTLQQCTFSLLMILVQKWAEQHEQGFYDGRNQFTCEKSKEILEKVKDMDLRAPFI